MSRPAAAVVGALLAVVLWASPAAGDPAGPTDYRSTVDAIDPPVPGLEAAVVGGDAFLELRSPPGREVVVVGYRGEPYLRFDAGGAVWENRRAPTAHLNQDRYGGTEPPPEASAEADPDWVEVADGGRYAWHDHRIHWMQPGRPLARQPGDTIVEAVVPLQVDGAPVELAVSSTWLPSPSPWPATVGAVGAAVLVVAVRAVAGRAAMVALFLALALAAGAVGAVAFWSVPPETGPAVSHLLLPVIAAALVAVAGLVPRWRSALILVAGVELALWGWIRRAALWRAVLPTDAPGWLDRSVTAAAITAGAAVVLIAAADGAFGPRRRRRTPVPG